MVLRYNAGIKPATTAKETRVVGPACAEISCFLSGGKPPFINRAQLKSQRNGYKWASMAVEGGAKMGHIAEHKLLHCNNVWNFYLQKDKSSTKMCTG